jgi:hypothetical protein
MLDYLESLGGLYGNLSTAERLELFNDEQIKELINFFDENDVIDSEYYDVYDEDDSDEDDSEDGDYLEDVNKKD